MRIRKNQSIFAINLSRLKQYVNEKEHLSSYASIALRQIATIFHRKLFPIFPHNYNIPLTILFNLC